MLYGKTKNYNLKRLRYSIHFRTDKEKIFDLTQNSDQ